MSPCWLRDYYTGTLKWDNTASSHKKREFIKELINCVDPSESEVVLKLYIIINPEHSLYIPTGCWMTWQKMCEHDDEEVITLLLGQGNIIKRLPAGWITALCP